MEPGKIAFPLSRIDGTSVTHEPRDPQFAERVRAGFLRQGFMKTLGAELVRVAPGEVDIDLPFSPGLTQQGGSVHAGAVTAVVDSACGFAALTLTPPGTDVVSVEFKINLLAPAVGPLLRARARVLRAGRTLIVCTGEVTTEKHGKTIAVAVIQATMMALPDRS